MRMLAVKNTIYVNIHHKRNSRSNLCGYACWIHGGGVQSGEVGLVGIKHDLRNLRRDKLEGAIALPQVFRLFSRVHWRILETGHQQFTSIWDDTTCESHDPEQNYLFSTHVSAK
jgi:hypothetical protein